MIRLHGCTGLGDCAYIYAIAKYLLDIEVPVRVQPLAYQKPAFDPLKAMGAEVGEYNERLPLDYKDVDCNYFPRKKTPGTNQFVDSCILAGVPVDVKLQAGYDRRRVTVDLSLSRKKLCLIKNPDYNGLAASLRELIPRMEFFQNVIDKYRKEYIFVSTGGIKDFSQGLRGIDFNLTRKTSLYDLFYLIDRSDMIVTRTGHLLPWAEAFGKKCFVVLSSRGLRSQNWIVKTITAEKIKCGPSSLVVQDNDPLLMEKFEAYRTS